MKVTTHKLVRDLKTVVDDAEELLEATAGQGGEQVERIRARAEESLRIARLRIRELTLAAEEHLHDAEHQVREHPWAALGVAAGIGALFGLVLGRK